MRLSFNNFSDLVLYFAIIAVIEVVLILTIVVMISQEKKIERLEKELEKSKHPNCFRFGYNKFKS